MFRTIAHRPSEVVTFLYNFQEAPQRHGGYFFDNADFAVVSLFLISPPTAIVCFLVVLREQDGSRKTEGI